MKSVVSESVAVKLAAKVPIETSSSIDRVEDGVIEFEEFSEL